MLDVIPTCAVGCSVCVSPVIEVCGIGLSAPRDRGNSTLCILSDIMRGCLLCSFPTFKCWRNKTVTSSFSGNLACRICWKLDENGDTQGTLCWCHCLCVVSELALGLACNLGLAFGLACGMVWFACRCAVSSLPSALTENAVAQKACGLFGQLVLGLFLAPVCNVTSLPCSFSPRWGGSRERGAVSTWHVLATGRGSCSSLLLPCCSCVSSEGLLWHLEFVLIMCLLWVPFLPKKKCLGCCGSFAPFFYFMLQFSAVFWMDCPHFLEGRCLLEILGAWAGFLSEDQDCSPVQVAVLACTYSSAI